MKSPITFNNVNITQYLLQKYFGRNNASLSIAFIQLIINFNLLLALNWPASNYHIKGPDGVSTSLLKVRMLKNIYSQCRNVALEK